MVSGAVPLVAAALGVVAMVGLVASRSRPFWTKTLPLTAFGCLGVVAAVDVLVEDVWTPFPDPLPVSNLAWCWVALVGLGLTAIRMASASWWLRAAMVGAALTVTAAAVVQVNVYWGLYPTVHAAWQGLWSEPPPPLPPTHDGGPLVEASAGQTIEEAWQPPAGMPDHGKVSEVDIPGVASHFVARRGYVYLPPAYLVTPRPLLPVLVLLAGQPGAPDNWINWLQLPDAMDAFARAHKGLAPVVIMPDDLGSSLANPVCVDSPRGNVETYLARDVPQWVGANLQVAADRSSWFIGGYSHGGTCSLQLALRAPDVYGGFVDIGGEPEPTIGSRKSTVAKLFGGSEAAFLRINPMDILRQQRFPHTVAFFIEGTKDSARDAGRAVFAACQAAGMDAQWQDIPGGHTPDVWRAAGIRSLPWVAVHSRLIPGP